MYYATAEANICGRVKTVADTPIVTRFVMLRLLPIFPIESYYQYCTPTTITGYKFPFASPGEEIYGAPLAKLDWTSVIMAYLRGLFGFLALFSFTLVFANLVASLNRQQPPDAFARIFLWICCAVLFISLAGSMATYLIPFTRARDERIRRHCALVLGYAFDPARVSPDFAEGVKKDAAEFDPDALHSPEMLERIALVQELIRLRCERAKGTQIGPMVALTIEELEASTDAQLDLLDELVKRPA